MDVDSDQNSSESEELDQKKKIDSVEEYEDGADPDPVGLIDEAEDPYDAMNREEDENVYMSAIMNSKYEEGEYSF